MINKGLLYWITGLPGSGKSTIGMALYYRIRENHQNVILLDGNNLKSIVEDAEGVDYSAEGRKKRAMKYAEICKLLTNQHMIVICCTVSMNEQVREWNRQNIERYAEIYIETPKDVLEKRDYRGIYSGFLNGCINEVVGCDIKADVPQSPNLKIVNDGTLSVDECVDMILDVIPSNLHEETDDSDYWNQYYADVNAPDAAPQEPSDFARTITEKYLVKGNRLLELGCGNGRDSIYFDLYGVNVVAIDSSSQTIKSLNKWRSDNHRSVLFACDDFTCTNAIYQQSFDYVYSRFTLHSITELQEIGVIRNVSNALNKNGLFFIEVRSVNDDIYGLGEAAGKDAYIYNGHYRRFIRKNEMEERLREIGGFEIVYSEEDRSFARYKDTDPPVIRIIARKSK